VHAKHNSFTMIGKEVSLLRVQTSIFHDSYRKYEYSSQCDSKVLLQVETGTDFVTDSFMSKGSVKWDSVGIGRI
jgi:hypothetical protein